MTCLHSWLKAEERDEQPLNGRELKQARKAQRFATLSIALESLPGDDDEDENADEDEDEYD